MNIPIILPICSLGGYVFTMDTAIVESIQRTWHFNIAKTQTKENMKTAFISPGERTITLPCSIYPGAYGQASIVEGLAEAATEGKPLLMLVNHRGTSPTGANGLGAAALAGFEEGAGGIFRGMGKKAMASIKNQGAARVYGYWYIESIRDTADKFDAQGQTRHVSFELTLTFSHDQVDWKKEKDKLVAGSIDAGLAGVFGVAF